MRIIVMGRALPQDQSSYGLFEFEQAKVLAGKPGLEVSYCFCDNRSILAGPTIKSFDAVVEGVRCCGVKLPVGGIPWKLFNVLRGRAQVRLLRKMIAELGEPDVLYVHFPAICLSPQLMDEIDRLSIPLVCIEHWSKVQARTLDAGRKAVLVRAVHQAKSFICVSYDLRDSVAELSGVSREKIDVIPNMVREDVFFRAPSVAADGASEPFRFITAGRLEKTKQFDLLVEAFAEVPSELDCALTIVGDGSHRGALERLVNKRNLGSRITFAGWRSHEEVADMMRSSDCYVSPSPFETFGLPLAEAWMCGLSCIAADNNPLRAYCAEGHGLLFVKDDEKSLADCLCRASSGSAFLSTEEISSWAYDHFSSQRISERIVALLQDACEDANR